MEAEAETKTQPHAYDLAGLVLPHLELLAPCQWKREELPGYDDGDGKIDERCRRQTAKIRTAGGMALWFFIQTWPKPVRLHISGELPRDEHGSIHGRNDSLRAINVNPLRDPAKIALEIKRRLLPIFEKTWAAAVESCEGANRRKHEAEALAERLAAILDTSVHGYHPAGEIRLYTRTLEGCGVTVTLRQSDGPEATFQITVPAHLAEQLATWCGVVLEHRSAREIGEALS